MSKAIIGIANFRETANDLLAIAPRIDLEERFASADYSIELRHSVTTFQRIDPEAVRAPEYLEENRAAICLSAYEDQRTYFGRKFNDLGLISRNDDNKVYVPWYDVEIHVSISGSIAA